MKKALVVLLALTFVGAVAFADMAPPPPLAISGSLETGAAVVLPHTGSALIMPYDNDSGHAARLMVGIAYTTADGNWGLITRLEAEGLSSTAAAQGGTGANFAGFSRALLWGNVAAGLVTLKAGVLDEEAFATENEGWGNYLDGMLGLEALIKPMPGLTIGYSLPLPNGGDTVLIDSALSKNPAGNGTAIDALSASSIELAYAMPNLANVVLGYRGGTAGADMNVAQKTAYLWGGVSVKAVPNLLARLEVEYANLGDSNAGNLQSLQEVAYTMGALVPDLVVIEDMSAASGTKLLWMVRPSVSYNLGMMTVGIGADIGTDTAYNWGVLGLGTIAPKNYSSPITGWDIWPNVSIPFGKNQINVALVYGQADTSNSATSATAIFVDYRVFF